MSVTLVFGTRPDSIKQGPVAAELARQNVPHTILCTGQHTDLLQGTPADGDLKGAVSLGLASKWSLLQWLRYADRLLWQEWVKRRPSAVLVQGDTMTALAAARTARRLDIPVGHIEAGLRSGDIANPWPEEQIRREISTFARWHWAPTGHAAGNLASEGILERVEATGNTVVDALRRYVPEARHTASFEPLVLVTLHRHEIQNKTAINALYGALRLCALEFPGLTFGWPLHPAVGKLLDRMPHRANLQIQSALPYREFAIALSHARGLLTDSGGAVEEAATLGVPTAILRATNDRPEAEVSGIAKRFDPTPSGVFAGLRWVLDAPRRPTSVFGDGHAAERIVSSLVRQL